MAGAMNGGTLQNPSWVVGWDMDAAYSEATAEADTQPGFAVPAPPPRCECGSGSNTRSGAHSHWCQLWVAP